MKENNDSESLLVLAVKYHQAGQMQQAEMLYREILAQNPNDSDANHNLGVLAAQHGHCDDAVNLFNKALHLNPRQIQYWVSTLSLLVKCGHDEQAKLLLRQAIEQKIENQQIEEIAKKLGIEVRDQQQTSSIKKKRKEPTRKSQPASEDIWKLEHLYQTGQIGKTIELAKSLSLKYKNNGLIWKVLGVVLRKAGQNKEAVKALGNAVRLLPDDAEAYCNWANALRDSGETEEAENAYKKSLSLNPLHINSMVGLSDMLREMSLNADAEMYARKALAIDPENAIAWITLANVQRDRSLFEAALSSYDCAIQLGQHLADAYNNKAVSLIHLERFREAEQAFNAALKIQPDHIAAINNMGRLYLESGELAKAEAYIKQALDLNPHYVDALVNMGNLCVELNLLNKAEEYISTALQLRPGDYKTLTSLLSIRQLKNDFEGNNEENSLEELEHANTERHQILESEIVTLQPFGRSGSLFFHSLLDGHPQVPTLPGIYLKGWFGLETWNSFKPDTKKPDWRIRLVQEVVGTYQAMFDANSRANVPGRPMAHTQWLARDQGFMEMGPERNQAFHVDAAAFSEALLALLEPLPEVSQRDCFELIHRAFDRAIRKRAEPEGSAKRIIFYHIHNPDMTEMANFLRNYPQAKQLWIVREPVQAMESWMVSAFELEALVGNKPTPGKAALSEIHNRIISEWRIVTGRVITMLMQLQTPFVRGREARGVRLEDVKRNPREIMPKVAAWMGIADDPAMYETAFCGMQYWGPASRMTGAITGFDTKSIDNKVGKLLGERDIRIFETLFWPLSSRYGYTTIEEPEFKKRLDEIAPWLDEPFEFEERLYATLPERTEPLAGLGPYRHLHRTVKLAWQLLKRNGTYGGIPDPLRLN